MTARRRAAKGDGSVYFDANAGRWVASVTVTGPDGTRRRRKMTAPDKATAQRHLKTMLAERDSTGTVSRKDITVGQVLDRFLAHPPAAWKSRTTVQVNRQLANRIKRGLSHVLVSKLSAGQVSEHLRREITGARPLARRTVKDELALLRRALRWAEANDLASRNVAALADMPEGAATRRSSSLTPAQVAQVLSADLTPFWRAWMAVGLMCGLRPGEAAGLAWSDIGDDGVLRVRAALHESPAGPVRGLLKTETSRRSLKMPQAVTDALTAWRAEQMTQQLAAGPTWCGTGLVFTTGFGDPVDRQRISRGFRAACQIAGIGDHWQPRELRHTFVSMLSAHGVDIEVISDAVGHANSGVTRTVYAHQITDQISSAAEVWDRITSQGAQP